MTIDGVEYHKFSVSYTPHSCSSGRRLPEEDISGGTSDAPKRISLACLSKKEYEKYEIELPPRPPDEEAFFRIYPEDEGRKKGDGNVDFTMNLFAEKGMFEFEPGGPRDGKVYTNPEKFKGVKRLWLVTHGCETENNKGIGMRIWRGEIGELDKKGEPRCIDEDVVNARMDEWISTFRLEFGAYVNEIIIIACGSALNYPGNKEPGGIAQRVSKALNNKYKGTGYTEGIKVVGTRHFIDPTDVVNDPTAEANFDLYWKSDLPQPIPAKYILKTLLASSCADLGSRRHLMTAASLDALASLTSSMQLACGVEAGSEDPTPPPCTGASCACYPGPGKAGCFEKLAAANAPSSMAAALELGGALGEAGSALADQLEVQLHRTYARHQCLLRALHTQSEAPERPSTAGSSQNGGERKVADVGGLPQEKADEYTTHSAAAAAVEATTVTDEYGDNALLSMSSKDDDITVCRPPKCFDYGFLVEEMLQCDGHGVDGAVNTALAWVEANAPWLDQLANVTKRQEAVDARRDKLECLFLERGWCRGKAKRCDASGQGRTIIGTYAELKDAWWSSTMEEEDYACTVEKLVGSMKLMMEEGWNGEVGMCSWTSHRGRQLTVPRVKALMAEKAVLITSGGALLPQTNDHTEQKICTAIQKAWDEGERFIGSFVILGETAPCGGCLSGAHALTPMQRLSKSFSDSFFYRWFLTDGNDNIIEFHGGRMRGYGQGAQYVLYDNPSGNGWGCWLDERPDGYIDRYSGSPPGRQHTAVRNTLGIKGHHVALVYPEDEDLATFLIATFLEGGSCALAVVFPSGVVEKAIYERRC